jgi:hypothetical protein
MDWILARPQARASATTNNSGNHLKQIENPLGSSKMAATSDRSRFFIDFATWYAAIAAPNSRPLGDITQGNDAATDQPSSLRELRDPQDQAA